MKDPLDDRSDPYQHFNDEARRQGKSLEVSLGTRPKTFERYSDHSAHARKNLLNSRMLAIS